MRHLPCSALALLTAALLGVAAAGCDPLKPPDPPKPVNAALVPEAAYTHDLAKGDTVLVARCRGADEYAQTTPKKDWVDHWYQVTMDVLAVERGTWTEKEVKFVYLDSWPTPESGIMVDKPPFPFGPGYVFALALKTSQTPACSWPRSGGVSWPRTGR